MSDHRIPKTHITEVEPAGKTWSHLSKATEECGNVRYERSDNSLVGATGSIERYQFVVAKNGTRF